MIKKKKKKGIDQAAAVIFVIFCFKHASGEQVNKGDKNIKKNACFLLAGWWKKQLSSRQMLRSEVELLGAPDPPSIQSEEHILELQ